MADHPWGYWFDCVGCGAPVGLFPDGCAALGLEPGSVMHTKPLHLEGIPNTVRCDVYERTDAEMFATLHAGRPEIEPPRGITRGKEYP